MQVFTHITDQILDNRIFQILQRKNWIKMEPFQTYSYVLVYFKFYLFKFYEYN